MSIFASSPPDVSRLPLLRFWWQPFPQQQPALLHVFTYDRVQFFPAFFWWPVPFVNRNTKNLRCLLDPVPVAAHHAAAPGAVDECRRRSLIPVDGDNSFEAFLAGIAVDHSGFFNHLPTLSAVSLDCISAICVSFVNTVDKPILWPARVCPHSVPIDGYDYFFISYSLEYLVLHSWL